MNALPRWSRTPAITTTTTTVTTTVALAPGVPCPKKYAPLTAPISIPTPDNATPTAKRPATECSHRYASESRILQTLRGSLAQLRTYDPVDRPPESPSPRPPMPFWQLSERVISGDAPLFASPLMTRSLVVASAIGRLSLWDKKCAVAAVASPLEGQSDGEGQHRWAAHMSRSGMLDHRNLLRSNMLQVLFKRNATCPFDGCESSRRSRPDQRDN